ncbi:MAG: hypothetical protein QOF40_3187, partial [Actinomycetota bacterium]|nr:hypothetical protein [Actinomycetota bacterium]
MFERARWKGPPRYGGRVTDAPLVPPVRFRAMGTDVEVL